MKVKYTVPLLEVGTKLDYVLNLPTFLERDVFKIEVIEILKFRNMGVKVIKEFDNFKDLVRSEIINQSNDLSTRLKG